MAHIIKKRLTKSNCKFAGLEKGWHNPIWNYQEFVGYNGAIQAQLSDRDRRLSVFVTDKGLLSLSSLEIEGLEEYQSLQGLSFPLDLDIVKEKIEKLLVRIESLHNFEGVNFAQIKCVANEGFQKLEELKGLHNEVVKYINETMGYTEVKCIPWLKNYISYFWYIFGAAIEAYKSSDWRVKQVARQNLGKLPELIKDIQSSIEKVSSSFSLAEEDRKQLYLTWLDSVYSLFFERWVHNYKDSL